MRGHGAERSVLGRRRRNRQLARSLARGASDTQHRLMKTFRHLLRPVHGVTSSTRLLTRQGHIVPVDEFVAAIITEDGFDVGTALADNSRCFSFRIGR